LHFPLMTWRGTGERSGNAAPSGAVWLRWIHVCPRRHHRSIGTTNPHCPLKSTSFWSHFPLADRVSGKVNSGSKHRRFVLSMRVGGKCASPSRGFAGFMYSMYFLDHRIGKCRCRARRQHSIYPIIHRPYGRQYRRDIGGSYG
jgi:hypothetical protein